MRHLLGFLMGICMPLWAGNLTTQGHGQVVVVPDLAHVTTEIHSEDGSASAALHRVQVQSDQLIAALAGLGIDEADMATSGLSVYPSQEWRDGRVVREFFVASHRLNVKVRALEDVGAVLDLMTSLAGHNSFSLRLDVADRAAAHQLALTRAMADARKKAEILVGAEELVLGPIQDIQSHLSESVSPQRTDTMEFDTSATGIAPGEMTISAFVSVVYALP